MIYALDTNIITFMLKDDSTVLRQADLATKKGHELLIPPIVDYEIRRGLASKQYEKRLDKFEQLQQILSIGAFDLTVWRKAAQIYASLREQGKLVEDADIFIAAFCIVGGYTLVTDNVKHFERIEGLKFVNWKK
jgi:predicted nucleic acid-binding protein